MQPASYCADYPVTNYSLEVTKVRMGEDPSGMIFTSLENLIKAENLSEDAIYVYIQAVRQKLSGNCFHQA